MGESTTLTVLHSRNLPYAIGTVHLQECVVQLLHGLEDRVAIPKYNIVRQNVTVMIPLGLDLFRFAITMSNILLCGVRSQSFYGWRMDSHFQKLHWPPVRS